MRPSRLKQGELKSIFTYLVLIGIPAQLYYGMISTCNTPAEIIITYALSIIFEDFTSIKIKYDEGFMELPGPDNTTEIMTVKHFSQSCDPYSHKNHILIEHFLLSQKPEQYWTKADEDLVIPTDYSLCVGFAIQT